MNKVALIAGLGLLAGTVALAQAKPAKITAHLAGAHCEACTVKLRAALGTVQGIKFNPAEIKPTQEPEFVVSSRFAIEVEDLAKTDVGAIGKAVATADTPHKGEHPPGLCVLFAWNPCEGDGEKAKEALAKVKGVDAPRTFGGDFYLWVRIDGSGQAKLAEIVQALKDAGVPIVQ